MCIRDREKPEDYQPPRLSIQQKEYRLLGNEEPGFAQLRAVLINKTNFDFDKIYSYGATSLTDYAVKFRYGEGFYFPSIEEAKEAIEIANKVKEFVKKKLKEKAADLRLESK